MNKVLVIGLDSGTWDIIKPMANDGKLPTIARLMKNGCYGDMMSSIPPVTFPAWGCYSRGKNPGKLGVYGFLNVDIEKQKVIVNTSLSFKGKELWGYLGKNDIICGVLDMPSTYPPKKINGFMVSNSLLDSQNFTYPKNLGDELRDKFNYKLKPDYSVILDKDLTILEYKDMTAQRFDAAKYLLKKFSPQFFHITIHRTDTIHHFFWKYMEKNDPKYGKVIEDFWIFIDNKIKLLLDEFCDEKTYVILMSDHGSTSYKGEFNIAQWAIKRKYMFLKDRKKSLFMFLPKFGVDLDNIISIIRKLKVYPLLKRIVPYNLRKKILFLPTKNGKSSFRELEPFIDWRKSEIIPLEGLYINTNIISRKDYEKFRNKLINEIENITSPNGEKLFKKVYKKEEIYNGRYVDCAPDVVVLLNDGYIISHNLSTEEWDLSRSRWSGCHDLYGIFCISGPDIKKNVGIQGVNIYDIAPTILHIFGIPTPRDMDGRVLKEIFREDSERAKKPTAYQEVGEKEMIKKKIRELKKRNFAA